MNAALNGLGSQLFGWFGQLSIELGVLALVVLAAGRLLPIKSPGLRHLLWVVVLLKPLVAVAVSSPFTLFTPFAPLVPLAESGRDALAFLPVEHPTVHAAASPIIATSSVGLTAAGWGAILWMAGASLLIGRILIGHGILWRLRRQAQVQRDGPLFDALRQARQAFDCYPRVEVATSPSTSSPMALGILRPIIVFPADLVDKLRADELSLILMHELAHVRRWDNLVLLLHRLVVAVLFFHPAVWLCGRMLRREAEQACDDLVVCATGRAKAYARGLAHVAERGSHFNPFLRRIPTMNAFAAVESDLALRIRRTLGGGARRMGARTRVLAAVLLCSLAVVTLPSYGTIPEVSKVAAEPSKKNLYIVVDQDGYMKLNDEPVTFATLEEELQAQRQLLDNTTMIVIQGDGRTMHGQIVQIMYVARQVGLVDQIVTSEVPEVAAELSGDDDNLTAENLYVVVDQDGNMKLNDESVTFATLEEKLQAKRQLLDNTTTIIIQGDERTPHGQVVQIMDTALQAGLVDQVIATEPQTEASGAAKQSGDNRIYQELETWGQAALIDPDDWSEELEAQLLALNPDIFIEEIAKEFRRRRLLRTLRATAEANPGTWWDKLKKDQLPDSTVTSEEIAEIRRRLQKALTEREKGEKR